MASQKRERKREGQAARRAALEAARRRKDQRKRFGLIGGIVVGLLVVAFIATQLAGGDDGTDVTSTSSTTATTAAAPSAPAVPPVAAGRSITGDTPCPKADGTEERASSFEKAPPMCIDSAKAYTAVFDTSAGIVRVALDTAKTPQTVNNFVVLARYKYYDGSSFQRTDPSIEIIQGGSPNTQTISDPGPGYTIKDEPTFTNEGGGLKGPYSYAEGDLVMARSGAADSASSQYFFSAGPKTKTLESQGTYVVFGRTAEGLDVLKKVLGSHKDCPPGAQACLGGSPTPAVVVKSITIEER